MSMDQPKVEVTHFEKEENGDCEEEIRWFDNYEKQLRTEATENLKREDFLNYFRYIQSNYCREISSDDDYRSSSVREFENVRRSVRNVKGKRMKSSRAKQDFGSRYRKARPRRKKNKDHREPCCPLERTDVDCNIQPLSGHPCVNKSHRPVTYPGSRLIRRHSSRLVSPKSYSRYIKRDLTRDYPGNIDIKVIHDWPDTGIDQRVPRSKDKVYRLETRRGLEVQKDSFEESLRKRSTDSIYINPRFDPNLNHEEAAAVNSRKELEVHRYLDKMNESSFQKRLSGGSNFSGSTNNQYCPRLNGPCSCEEETNKSRNFNCEKDVLSSSKRKEKKICEKNFDWIFKDASCTKSKSRYPPSRSFTSLSSTQSTKGVTFDKNLVEMPIISERTSCQVPRSSRKNDKSSFIEKKVHYEPKCIETSDLSKDKDLCYICENEKIDNIRNRKLCKLVRSKEGKLLMKCCCSNNEQENNTKCNDCCCCPENRKQFQVRQKCDISTNYEKYLEDKNYLHTSSLPSNNFRIDSPDKPIENISKKKEDLSLKTPFLDHWKKCNERLKEVSKDYQKLSSNLKIMRDIYCRHDKTRRKTDGSYPSGKDSSFVEPRVSPKRTIDVRSSFRPNEIEENDDCDCREFFRETLPSSYPYDRYRRSMKRHERRHDTKSKKKLEKDSIRMLKGFCDRVKTVDRSFGNRKGNLEGKTLNENRVHQECRYDSETSVQELWGPIKMNNVSRKEWPGNSVDLRIVKPKNSSGKTSFEKILIYPPDDVTGPPLTLFKNSSNISCQVKGNEDNGYRYNVTYVQKFISPIWRPEIECPGNKICHRRNECDCSSDYG